MQYPADIFLALRYLRPKRTFISIITLLSVLGPILGVALLVIVTAVMSGFDREIRERILDMQAHLHIQAPHNVITGESQPLRDTAPVLEAVREAGGSGSPLLEGPVLIQLERRVEAKFVKGILPETERGVTRILANVRGSHDIQIGEGLIGEEMAYQLGLAIGDHLLIHSPSQLTANLSFEDDGRMHVKEIKEVYLPEEVRIVGIFSMGVYEFDSSIIFIHLDQAADLFGHDWGTASSVHVAVPDPFHMAGITADLQAALPDYQIVTWQQANRQLFGALKVEKNLLFFLLVPIVVVSAFSITATMITVVVQKTTEIGILKAIGTTSAGVARIFLLQGSIIGIVGTTIGTGAGLLVIHCRNQVAAVLARIMGTEVFPKELYHLSQIPAQVTRGDLGTIVALALAICVLASVIPALYASLLQPAKALQVDN